MNTLSNSQDQGRLWHKTDVITAHAWQSNFCFLTFYTAFDITKWHFHLSFTEVGVGV